MQTDKYKIKLRDIEALVCRRRFSRRLSIAINSAGAITVRTGLSVPKQTISDFVANNYGWIVAKQKQLQLNAKKIVLPDSLPHFYTRNKARALRIIKGRLDYYKLIYGFSFNRVLVKNQSSKWGSCSQNKNLNFSYKVAFLPEPLLDYVVVHELCHLQELNHSVSFWRLVERTVADWRRRRAELKNIVFIQ